MSKEAARAARRARMLARGRTSFALRFGVLGWGVSTALIFALYQGFAEGWEAFPRWLAISLLIFPIGGWFWGVLMWRFVIRAAKGSGDTR
jgi:uncharacterized membrane protein